MKPSRSALVTGAARGIGRAIAERLAADGLGVSVADLASSRDQVEALVANLGGPEAALGLTVDVTDADSVEGAVADHVQHFGGLDVMVANAGIAVTAPLLETTAEQWQLTMEVNLRGVFHCYQSAARQMISQGPGWSTRRRCLGRGTSRREMAVRVLRFEIRGTRSEPIGRPGTRSVSDHRQCL
jgi:meso-butanediol dehydrogenase/(S,S)-butanediol dehydrogenase/diacetyl reductase